MFDDVTCIILAGGKSSRIGSNKALLTIGGKKIIEIINHTASEIFSTVIIISNEPDEYIFLNRKVVKDIFPGKGPLSGIHTGLVESTTARTFFISCDLPLVTGKMIEHIIKFPTTKPITIPIAQNYLQTLCAVYDKTCLPHIERRLRQRIEEYEGERQRRFSIIDLMQEVGAEIVDVTNQPFYNDNIFFNLNSMNDYAEIQKMMSDKND